MGALISFRSAGRLLRCGDFAPAGDLLSWSAKKVGKEAAPAAPPLGYEGFPAMLETRGRPELAALRSAQTSGASQTVEARKRAPRVPVLLGGAEGECEQPNRRVRVLGLPCGFAEKHSVLRRALARINKLTLAACLSRA